MNDSKTVETTTKLKEGPSNSDVEINDITEDKIDKENNSTPGISDSIGALIRSEAKIPALPRICSTRSF